MPDFGHKSDFRGVEWVCFRNFYFYLKSGPFVGCVGRSSDFTFEFRKALSDQFDVNGTAGNLHEVIIKLNS